MAGERGRVYLVDDDVLVRRALVRLIASAGHDVIAHASARDFLESGHRAGNACLVLDVRLPDMDGLEVYRRLREQGDTLPVIFMTGFGDIPMTVQAMKAGAADFLPKPVSDDALLNAIDAAIAQGIRMHDEFLEVQELSRRYATLTGREREVLGLVLAGRLNKQIAHELGISEKTVKVHRGRLMAKMGARRVAQLVQFAVRLGIEAGPPPSRPAQESGFGLRRGSQQTTLFV